MMRFAIRFILTLLLVASTPKLTAAQESPTTAPAAPNDLAEGPLKITITGVDGIAQYRMSVSDKWQRATVGIELSEGAEFRTGPHSAVRFIIPPDQTATLDRLGTVKVLRANFENGKLFTDLGMKYGRTRYEIEGAGREHDAKVHSPSSVLAVRGTEVSLLDQPPFGPEAVSLTGRAVYHDSKKTVSFGGKNAGTTPLSGSSPDPAAEALSMTTLDPKGQFVGRTQTDLDFQLAQSSYAGTNLANIGILKTITQPAPINAPPPSSDQLLIDMSFQVPATEAQSGTPDITLQITDPKGEILSPTHLTTADGGVYQGLTFNASTGAGQINAEWPISFPKGKYTFLEQLITGPVTTANLQIAEFNPTTLAQANSGPFSSTLSAAAPSFTVSDTFPKLAQPAVRIRKP